MKWVEVVMDAVLSLIFYGLAWNFGIRYAGVSNFGRSLTRALFVRILHLRLNVFFHNLRIARPTYKFSKNWVGKNVL